MKLALLIGSATVAATLLATYGPGERVLAALGLGPAPQHYLGYVEGESTLVAPPVSGRLVARLVERGGRVAKGDRPDVIDTTQAEAEVAEVGGRGAWVAAREGVGGLAARDGEIAAAAAMIEQSQANLARARNRLFDLMPVALEEALVENTFFNVGEWVSAGSPVVSLLPEHNVKLRFFVHEEDVARPRPGRQVRFSCDGCPAGLTAAISYVAPRAEYTPPIIYSQNARAKLAFMVEARPDPTQSRLPARLPVTVEPLTDSQP